MNLILITISAIVLTVVLGVGLVHLLMKIMLNEDIYIDTCEHGKTAISQCSKCNFGYDFQEDIANYNNDWNEYDYDTHKQNQYEFDIASEAELSQEYIQNHTEEDKN